MNEQASTPSGSDVVADLVRRTEMVSKASTEAVAGLDNPVGGDPLTGAIVEQLHAVHAECERIHGILERVAGMMAAETPAAAPEAAAPQVAATPVVEAAPTAEAAPVPEQTVALHEAPINAPAPVSQPVGADAMPPPSGVPVQPFQADPPPAAVEQPLQPVDPIGPPPGDAPIAVPSGDFVSSGTATSYPGTDAADVAPTSEPAPTAAAAPVASGNAEPSDGVRLLATQMAVAGETAGDIERRLREDFGVADSEAIVRELFGPS